MTSTTSFVHLDKGEAVHVDIVKRDAEDGGPYGRITIGPVTLFAKTLADLKRIIDQLAALHEAAVLAALHEAAVREHVEASLSKEVTA